MKYLQIKTLPAGTFQDVDTLILHAAFQCLSNYVEIETENFARLHGENPDDPTIKELYEWWQEYIEEEGTAQMDERRYAEETRQLIRLMMVRKSLWT